MTLLLSYAPISCVVIFYSYLHLILSTRACRCCKIGTIDRPDRSNRDSIIVCDISREDRYSCRELSYSGLSAIFPKFSLDKLTSINTERSLVGAIAVRDTTCDYIVVIRLSLGFTAKRDLGIHSINGKRAIQLVHSIQFLTETRVYLLSGWPLRNYDDRRIPALS
jgi:hypothetical protein